MTIEVDPTGPGTAIYKSTLWACSVNAQSAYVYKAARTVINYSPLWSGPGAYVTLHWVTFGSNETTTVKLVRQSGTISTVDVYPHIKQFAATWTSNTITLTLPLTCMGFQVIPMLLAAPGATITSYQTMLMLAGALGWIAFRPLISLLQAAVGHLVLKATGPVRGPSSTPTRRRRPRSPASRSPWTQTRRTST